MSNIESLDALWTAAGLTQNQYDALLSVDEMGPCRWSEVRDRTRDNGVSKRLMSLRREGLVKWASGRWSVTDKGREVARIIRQQEMGDD